MTIKQKRLITIVPGSYNEERCHQYAVAFLKKYYPQFLDEFEKFWKKKEEVGIHYTLPNLIYFTYPKYFKQLGKFKDEEMQQMDEKWYKLCQKLSPKFKLTI